MTVLLIITLSGCSGQKEQRVYTKEKPLVLRMALVDGEATCYYIGAK